MRITAGPNDRHRQKQKLFQALVQECQLACPASRLAEKIRRRISELPKVDRKDLVSQTVEGCSPLFLACKNGSAEIAEYLVSSCDADIEQRGLYEVLDEGVSHSVTPLWCAAVSGRLAVVKVLLRYGADVNAVSDSGSTPIRSACYIVRHGMNSQHLEIIKCLVRAGADVQQANHFGGTCLINSVQSPELIKFLLESGVNVNAEDVQHKTACHYAVQENRLESAKLLLKAGADPYKMSKYGDDILQTACLKGALMIFNYLLENVIYEPERIASAFELMGTTFLLDLHDISSTLFFWRKALEIRHEGSYKKYPKPYLGVHRVLGVHEIDSKDELEVIIEDSEALKFQALLMSERILGTTHKDTIFRYMYAGAAYADSNEYRSCTALWNHALQLKIRKETLLSCDTSFTARAIVQLYINILMRNDDDCEIRFADVVNTVEHVNEGLVKAMTLLDIQPVFKAQVDNFDVVLTSWIHLMYVILKVAQTEEDYCTVFRLVNKVIKLSPVTSLGDSLLHLAVSSSSTLRSSSFLDEDSFALFPSLDVTSFLLRSGFDLSSRNFRYETPLHIAAKMENYSDAISKLLLDYGAHIDVPDANGITPQDIYKAYKCNIRLMPYISLKCLASVIIHKEGVPYEKADIPVSLQPFLNMH